MDALKLLAGRYGIPIPEKQKTAAEIAREKQRDSIYSANELASKFFRLVLQELLTVNLPWLILPGVESAKKLLPALA